jgi:hypothetical protein
MLTAVLASRTESRGLTVVVLIGAAIVIASLLLVSTGFTFPELRLDRSQLMALGAAALIVLTITVHQSLPEMVFGRVSCSAQSVLCLQ